MKKLIYSSVIAIMTVASVTAVASAAGSSLIGKKVQRVISLAVDGKAIKDAVVIDGVTYAPVRSLSDAAGYALKVEGGSVELTTGTTDVTKENDQAPAIREQIYKLGEQVKWYQIDIKIASEETIPPLEEQLKKEKAYTTDVDAHALIIEGVEKKLKEERARIADLQSKVDAANAEIAKLQEQLK
ncbi:hypothetical protein [Paenibacillus sp. FSL W8-0194]|uniref:hypothetical protein n=1 Tax=Paenibacillus sp. FSL W8-0194 TaxID=2921711 RepID=UPI0030DA725B